MTAAPRQGGRLALFALAAAALAPPAQGLHLVASNADSMLDEDADLDTDLDDWRNPWSASDNATWLHEQHLDFMLDDENDTQENDTQENDTQEFGLAPKQLVLLGMQDSGTNLVMHMLYEHWPKEVMESCKWENGKLPDYNIHCNLYKHSNNGTEDIYRALNDTVGSDLSNAVLIAMVRSPVSMVHSWRKSPYILEFCLKRTWEEMQHPCSTALGAYGCRHARCPPEYMKRQWFASTMEVYNSYLRLYKALQEEGKFARVRILPYEDAVLSPQDTLRMLQEDLMWPERKKYRALYKKAKPHGDSVTREQALRKLQRRGFLRELPKAARKSLCPGLDFAAVAGIWEGSFLPEDQRHPYGEDCIGYLPK